MGFAPDAKLDGLVAEARARRPRRYRLTERVLRLPRDRHSTFADHAPARASHVRAGARRCVPPASRAARLEPSSVAASRRAVARAATAAAVQATLPGRAAVAAIRLSASQHGVRLPNRAGAA